MATSYMMSEYEKIALDIVIEDNESGHFTYRKKLLEEIGKKMSFGKPHSVIRGMVSSRLIEEVPYDSREWKDMASRISEDINFKGGKPPSLTFSDGYARAYMLGERYLNGYYDLKTE